MHYLPVTQSYPQTISAIYGFDSGLQPEIPLHGRQILPPQHQKALAALAGKVFQAVAGRLPGWQIGNQLRQRLVCPSSRHHECKGRKQGIAGG